MKIERKIEVTLSAHELDELRDKYTKEKNTEKFMAAIKANDLENAKKIYEKGLLDVNGLHSNRFSLLHVAIIDGVSEEIIDFLLSLPETDILRIKHNEDALSLAKKLSSPSIYKKVDTEIKRRNLSRIRYRFNNVVDGILKKITK